MTTRRRDCAYQFADRDGTSGEFAERNDVSRVIGHGLGLQETFGGFDQLHVVPTVDVNEDRAVYDNAVSASELSNSGQLPSCDRGVESSAAESSLDGATFSLNAELVSQREREDREPEFVAGVNRQQVALAPWKHSRDVERSRPVRYCRSP